MTAGKKVSFKEACTLIKKGSVVAIPTETVYGLAGNIQNEAALRQIFQIKKRPLFDPLIIHFAEKKQLYKICECPPIAEKLSNYFHPGPLSLVLKKKPVVSSLITAGSSRAAVRMPDHPITLKLIQETDMCLAAPSANLFSKTSPTRACHVLEALCVPVLDGGPCLIGIESTIVEVLEEKKTLSILRPGVIDQSELTEFLRRHRFTDWKIQYDRKTSAPGQTSKHYQPDIPFIVFKSRRPDSLSSKIIQEKIKQHYPQLQPKELKLKDDPFISGRELYHRLRQLSKESENVVGYVVQNVHSQKNQPAWRAIWDRLEKASCQTLWDQ